MGTDRDWERWGASDPYFGVCSDAKFRGSVEGQARAEFFTSGERHVSGVLAKVRETAGVDFMPRTALDFGCGVGRLVIPLARIAERVVGVDISPSMIEEAKRNCAAAGVRNVMFVQSDDAVTQANGAYDLVHSHIVLQHIPWARGRKIIRALADRVAPGGFLVIQVLSEHHGNPLVRALVRARYAFPPVNWLRNILKGRPITEPAMELHVYDLDAIKSDLSERWMTARTPGSRWKEFTTTTIIARRASGE